MPGTFYSRVTPDAPPLKREGDPVRAGEQVCLVEVMKTFLPIVAEEAGVFARYCVGDGELIDVGYPIYSIEV
jgi:biotin carboxyl carrier protein